MHGENQLLQGRWHCWECHQNPSTSSLSSPQHTPMLSGHGHRPHCGKCSLLKVRKQHATSKPSGHLPGTSKPSLTWPVFPSVLAVPLSPLHGTQKAERGVSSTEAGGLLVALEYAKTLISVGREDSGSQQAGQHVLGQEQ